MKVVSLFDGIACARQALHNLDVDLERYYSYEIDRRAREVAHDRWRGKEMHWMGTVYAQDWKNNFPEDSVDLLIGGSPCQDLSQLTRGAKGLLGTKSMLMEEYFRALRDLKTKWFILENVVPQKRNWADQISELAGVQPVAINSRLFGHQNRPRLYWTNIPLGELPAEPHHPGTYRNANPYHASYYVLKNGVAPALVAHNQKRGDRHRPQKLVDGKWEVLTPEDHEELQGLPRGYTSAISHCYRYGVLGNAFTVDVIAWIINHCLTIEKDTPKIDQKTCWYCDHHGEETVGAVDQTTEMCEACEHEHMIEFGCVPLGKPENY